MTNTRPIPTYLAEAAQRMLADAPDISGAQITDAFRALGVDSLADSSDSKPGRAA